MRKTTSRILALALALVLVLSMVPATTAHAASTKTIYFQNNWLWTDVSIHYWGGSSATTWPGVKMTLVENDGNYDIYKAEIPADSTGIIFNGIKNDGSNALDQTTDITDIQTGVYYYMVWNDKNDVATTPYNPTGEEDETTAPTSNPTVPDGEDKVIYFTNTSNWNTVNAYYWNVGGEIGWPGLPMTNVEDNIYSIVVPAGMKYIIFNDGNAQTANITLPTDNKNMYNNGAWSVYQVCAHSWGTGDVTTQPTCTAEGVKTYTCSLCGETKTETVDALGHSYVGGKCTVCGATEPCTEHSWDNGIETTPATCTSSGVKTYTCSKCGNTKTETISSLGHNMVDGTCTRCGESDNCSHFWRGGSTVSATCEKEGYTTYTCLLCKGTKKEVIPAKGHKYAAGRCYVCGAEQENIEFVDIATAADLLAFANRVNAGENTLNGRLTADIDLGGASWTAIGYYCKNGTDSLFYKGRFDGQGHTISNFKSAGTDCEGLFGYCEMAVIENLGVVNANITGWNAGAIAGYAPTSSIENCYAKDCTITGYTTNSVAVSSRAVHVGAVAGCNGGTVKNCYAINCTLIDKTGSMTVPSDYPDDYIAEDGTLIIVPPYYTCNVAPVGGSSRSNNYYCSVSGTFTATSGATEVTAAQMASGEVTYKLNNGVVNGTQAWYQTCGQGLPAHSGKTVYESNGSYTNDGATCAHNWTAATCTAPKTCSICGATEGAALGHNWTAATCTAPKTCSVCGETEGTALGHSYVEGTCTVCGAADPDYKPVVETFTISLAQVELGNALNLSFLFPVDAYADWSGCYAEVTKTYADGRDNVTVTVPADQWEDKASGGVQYKKIGFHNISAKEMADSITIQVFNADGVAISNQHSDSIVGYLERMLGKNSNAEFRALAVDMLNYGAAAQTQFNYNLDNLANANIGDYQQYGTAADAVCVNNQVKGDNVRGASVSLENNIIMNVYFTNQTADMTAEVTFKNHAGTDMTVVLTSVDTSNGYCFQIDKLAVADMRTMVTITCKDADGNVYGTLTDSVEGYVARTGATKAINQAIMKFSDSAYAYLH